MCLKASVINIWEVAWFEILRADKSCVSYLLFTFVMQIAIQNKILMREKNGCFYGHYTLSQVQRSLIIVFDNNLLNITHVLWLLWYYQACLPAPSHPLSEAWYTHLRPTYVCVYVNIHISQHMRCLEQTYLAARLENQGQELHFKL